MSLMLVRNFRQLMKWLLWNEVCSVSGQSNQDADNCTWMHAAQGHIHTYTYTHRCTLNSDTLGFSRKLWLLALCHCPPAGPHILTGSLSFLCTHLGSQKITVIRRQRWKRMNRINYTDHKLGGKWCLNDTRTSGCMLRSWHLNSVCTIYIDIRQIRWVPRRLGKQT